MRSLSLSSVLVAAAAVWTAQPVPSWPLNLAAEDGEASFLERWFGDQDEAGPAGDRTGRGFYPGQSAAQGGRGNNNGNGNAGNHNGNDNDGNDRGNDGVGDGRGNDSRGGGGTGNGNGNGNGNTGSGNGNGNGNGR